MMRVAIEVLTSGGSSCWSPKGRDALVSAIEVLRDLDMPPDEVDAVVAADQPVIVHRYMELHRERLEERLADQVRTLERVKRILTPAIPEAAYSLYLAFLLHRLNSMSRSGARPMSHPSPSSFSRYCRYSRSNG